MDNTQSLGTKRTLQLTDRKTTRKEQALKYLFMACATVSVVAVVLIFVFTIFHALPLFSEVGPGEFFSLKWSPTNHSFGIGSLLVGSIIVTVGALALGVPLALGCAVYLTEVAQKRFARIVSSAVDLLAGIPSVIYGFFGLVILRPLIAEASGGLGFGACITWIVLAIMIVPTITTLTIDALHSVPKGIREASYSMGATRWQTIYKVVIPAARVGIINAIVLGMGRAIGETMAVLMVVGNAPVVPKGIFSPLSTLTSQIALDMGYSTGLHRSALFAMGVVLFVISASLVGTVRHLSKKQRKIAKPHRKRKKHARGDSAKVAQHTFTPATARSAMVVAVEGNQRPDFNLGGPERTEAARKVSKRSSAQDGKLNRLMLGLIKAAALLTTGILLVIIIFVVVNGAPAISPHFIFGWPEGVNAEGGIWPTIVSTLYVVALSMILCVPLAVLSAVYLAEYAQQGKLVDYIRFAADTLASVPSIVMGLFGYALFVEAMGLGLSMLSAAMALALLMLPIVMRTTEEAIRAVPRYIRWGAYGLGATKWQVIKKVVLPSAFSRIATGIVLAMGRAVGETAVVLYTMGQAINMPLTPIDSGRPMTVHLYLLANDGINMNAAYGTALLLMVLIFAFNMFARHISKSRA